MDEARVKDIQFELTYVKVLLADLLRITDEIPPIGAECVKITVAMVSDLENPKIMVTRIGQSTDTIFDALGKLQKTVDDMVDMVKGRLTALQAIVEEETE